MREKRIDRREGGGARGEGQGGRENELGKGVRDEGICRREGGWRGRGEGRREGRRDEG